MGSAVRVHSPVPGGPKMVLGGGSVGNRPAAGDRLRGRGTDRRASPAGRTQKVPRRGEGPKISRPVGESTGGGVEPAWRGSLSRAGRTSATPSLSEGTEPRGSRRGPGLGDQLAGGPRGPPNNHNGGSPADPSVLWLGGVLGPRDVRDQSPPDPVVQPDDLRPPLFRGGGGALFLLLLRELFCKLAWLSVALKTSVRLLMLRHTCSC